MQKLKKREEVFVLSENPNRKLLKEKAQKQLKPHSRRRGDKGQRQNMKRQLLNKYMKDVLKLRNYNFK